MKRETLRRILRGIILGLTRTTYEGLEYLPPDGGFLITTNHMSRLDTLLLFINTRRIDVTALVADKYQKYPLFKWILETGGIIWLDRDSADFGAIRAAVGALKQGLPLGIAPEGTRSRTAQLLEGKAGAVLVALKAGVPIVPVGIAGSEDVIVKALTLRFPKVTVRFGPAYTLPPLERDRRDEQLQQYTAEIMCRIAVLMPEKYHGFYRDHPRLKELLAESKPAG
jgi:1-acyl-sn-glycerol-3-phosphate acyltransferase